jgi:site-specific DNA-methyltransferase (adenine-specific)
MDNNIQLYLGDCLKIMPSLEDKSVDMILCDLPYGKFTHCNWDILIPFESLWGQYERIIKDCSAMVFTANQPFTSALIMSNLNLFKHEWVWDKHIPRGFQVAKYRPMRKHEDICVFGRGKIKYFPIKILRDKPVTVKNYGKGESASIGKYNDTSKSFTYTHKSPDTIITGCWEANAGKLHPTQKPVALMEYLIKTYTNEGDLVLDNCMGSGTTGVACKNLNRKFIGIEMDENYMKIATERIKNTIKGV